MHQLTKIARLAPLTSTEMSSGKRLAASREEKKIVEKSIAGLHKLLTGAQVRPVTLQFTPTEQRCSIPCIYKQSPLYAILDTMPFIYDFPTRIEGEVPNPMHLTSSPHIATFGT